MDYRQLFRDIFSLNTTGLRLRGNKLVSIVKRKFVGQNPDDVVVADIPVIINNRNRYTYLLQLIHWLEKAGMNNITILDNDSTYPPLLEYYSTTAHRVVKLGENVGHLALWKSDLYNEIKSKFYIYTDPDVVPAVDCPNDLVTTLLAGLKKYNSIDKIGVGLKIDDLPDHYDSKKKVMEWESQFWKVQVDPGIFNAGVDTTFALYRPYTNGAIWVAPAYRTGPPYVAHHMPWYENSEFPGEENLYYAQNVRQGASHWIQKK